jgi:hypothetical protein
MEGHEHEHSYHRHDGLGLGVPCWIGVMWIEVEMMEWAPADECFYVIVRIVCEPGTGEPMDIVFERIEIGSGVLRVWEPVIRPVIVWVFGNHLEVGTFRCRCGIH